MEIWKDVPAYGNHYQASNLGNIRSKDRIVEKFSYLANKVVKQSYKGKNLLLAKNKDGHLSVRIGYNKKKYTAFAHRLVLMAFVGMPLEGQECCHNNGISDDNRVENLRWDTHANNNKDRKLHGTYPTGKEHPMYGKKMSDEHKLKLMLINKGKKASLETKQKMSLSQKKRWSNVQK